MYLTIYKYTSELLFKCPNTSINQTACGATQYPIIILQVQNKM